MPDPDRLLATFRQALRAFQETPGRSGRVVHLTDVDDVLVAGDLHGNVENFRSLLKMADLVNHPRRHLVLQELVHGPFLYPNGGDKSHQLVDMTAALKCQFPRQVHYLMGNHELSEWTACRIAKNNQDLNEGFRQGINSAYGNRGDEMYAAYRELFQVIPVALRSPNRVFLSHSLPRASRLVGFDPAILEKLSYDFADWTFGGAMYDLVWGRDTSANTVQTFLGKTDADLLITGHIACEHGYATPNDRQLILDSLGTPACVCLFPTDRPLTHTELVACLATL